MKLILLLTVVMTLPCCVTRTETRPDGTVITIKSIDTDAIDSSGKLVSNIAPWFSSK